MGGGVWDGRGSVGWEGAPGEVRNGKGHLGKCGMGKEICSFACTSLDV